jgi:ribonuclease D
MFTPSLSKDEILLLPLKSFEGEIIVIEDIEQITKHIRALKKESILGFDTETRPSFQKGHLNQVALLQLSTATKAYLFRINKIGLPSSLAAILANPSIIKVGAAIRDDLRILRKIKPFTESNFIDLQKYVQPFGIESIGVSSLTAIVLNFRISKSQQLSNWENETLVPAQMSYAATDAWVCREIYCKLINSTEK